MYNYLNEKTTKEMQECLASAGWREKKAMRFGRRRVCTISGHKCYMFLYGKKINGVREKKATYDFTIHSWIE